MKWIHHRFNFSNLRVPCQTDFNLFNLNVVLSKTIKSRNCRNLIINNFQPKSGGSKLFLFKLRQLQFILILVVYMLTVNIMNFSTFVAIEPSWYFSVGSWGIYNNWLELHEKNFKVLLKFNFNLDSAPPKICQYRYSVKEKS